MMKGGKREKDKIAAERKIAGYNRGFLDLKWEGEVK